MHLSAHRSLTTATCLVVMALLFGEVIEAADKDGVEAEVASIRKFYAEVEALQELDKKDFVFKCPGEPMEGVLTRRSRRDSGSPKQTAPN